MRNLLCVTVATIVLLSYTPFHSNTELSGNNFILSSNDSIESTNMFHELGDNITIEHFDSDSEGNLIAAGYIYENGALGSYIVEVEQYENAAFIAKIDENMELIWYKIFDDKDELPYLYITNLIIDSNNEVVIHGYYRGIFDYGDLYSQYNDTEYAVSFLSKLNADGDFVYFNDFGSYAVNAFLSIDLEDNVCLSLALGSNISYLDFSYTAIEGYSVLISAVSNEGSLLNPLVFDVTPLSINPTVSRTVHTTDGDFLTTTIKSPIYHNDESYTCVDDIYPCNLLLKIDNSNKAEYSQLDFGHHVRTIDMVNVDHDELLFVGQEVLIDIQIDDFGNTLFQFKQHSCPMMAKISYSGNLISQTVCEKTDLNYNDNWQIGRAFNYPDEQIIIIGDVGGTTNFANSSLQPAGQRWIASISYDLEIEWSMTAFSQNTGHFSDGYLVLPGNLFFSNIIDNFLIVPQKGGLLYIDINDIDGDGVNNGNDLCLVGEVGYISNTQNDYDNDGCKDSSEDLDDDNDGWFDESEDLCLADSKNETILPIDSDSDSICDVLDYDDDNDGFNDSTDAFPLNNSEWLDLDSDGFGDNSDDCIGNYGTSTIDRIGCIDQDGDGISDLNDEYPYDSSRSTSNNVESEAEKSSSESNSALYIITILVIISIVIIFYFKRRGTLDDDESEVEELYVSGHNNEQENSPIMQKPDFTLKGEDHESGYEVVEYPQESGTWWWKDYETETWVLWE